VTDLQSNAGYGVTVVVNGETTVAAASAPNVGVSATSICSSLSTVACGNVQSTQCAQYGNAANMARGPLSTAVQVAWLAAGVGAALVAAF
jgi:hypothetical protein